MRNSNQIGKILCRLRNEKHISQSKLCRGLCSVSALSRYELGERVPDRLLLNALLQRMGAAPVYMISMINAAEYFYLSWKKRVLQAAKDNNISVVKSLLTEQTASDTTLSNALQKQFLYIMQAYVSEYDGNFSESIRLLKEAIELTLPNYIYDSDDRLMSVGEALMLIKLSELYIKINQDENSKYLLNKIIENEDFHCQDDLLLKTYPKAVRLIAPLLIKSGDFSECEELCYRAIEMLRSAGIITDLDEIIESYIKCSGQSGYVDKCRKWLWALKCVNENYGMHSSDSILVYQWEQEIYLVNEVIRDYRATSELSQEEMSFGLFSTETLSRAENGKHSLSIENYNAIREKLSVDEEYFNSRLNTTDYSVLEKMDKVYRAITVGHYDDALELLAEVEQKMQSDGTFYDDYNQKFIEAIKVCVLHSQKKVSGGELIAECEKVLGCRYEDIFDEAFWKRFLSKEKADLLNFIAIAIVKSEREKAVYIWEHILQKLEKSRVELADRYSSAITVIDNLSTCYGVMGRYQECIDICEKGIQLCFERGKYTSFSKLMGNHAESYIFLGKNKETYRKTFQQVYYLGDMFRIIRENKYYDKFYRENFDDSVVWY